MTKKISLEKVPKTTCISFINDIAQPEFDDTFSVPLDKERLEELHRQCARALEVYEAYKREEIEETE